MSSKKEATSQPIEYCKPAASQSVLCFEHFHEQHDFTMRLVEKVLRFHISKVCIHYLFQILTLEGLMYPNCIHLVIYHHGGFFHLLFAHFSHSQPVHPDEVLADYRSTVLLRPVIKHQGAVDGRGDRRVGEALYGLAGVVVGHAMHHDLADGGAVIIGGVEEGG